MRPLRPRPVGAPGRYYVIAVLNAGNAVAQCPGGNNVIRGDAQRAIV